jgi:hypothetical protein
MAVEIRLKYKYRCTKTGKSNASRNNNNGPARHRGETDKGKLAVAQAATRQNQMVLHMLASGKFRWERVEA